jgi:hypothetical protein
MIINELQLKNQDEQKQIYSLHFFIIIVDFLLYVFVLFKIFVQICNIISCV